jgi:putative flavoprotein involved in K+ transport
LREEIRRKVGQLWGLGSGLGNDPGPWEGELRNMWKPTRQAGLWFHSGGIGMSRIYSRLLALQIQARQAGIPTPVYRGAPIVDGQDVVAERLYAGAANS